MTIDLAGDASDTDRKSEIRGVKKRIFELGNEGIIKYIEF